MAIRARGDKLTTFKILFYLYFHEATVPEIIEDLLKQGLHPYTIRNDLSRLKKIGLLSYENKRYRLNRDLRNGLDEIVKAATLRKSALGEPRAE